MNGVANQNGLGSPLKRRRNAVDSDGELRNSPKLKSNQVGFGVPLRGRQNAVDSEGESRSSPRKEQCESDSGRDFQEIDEIDKEFPETIANNSSSSFGKKLTNLEIEREISDEDANLYSKLEALCGSPSNADGDVLTPSKEQTPTRQADKVSKNTGKEGESMEDQAGSDSETSPKCDGVEQKPETGEEGVECAALDSEDEEIMKERKGMILEVMKKKVVMIKLTKVAGIRDKLNLEPSKIGAKQTSCKKNLVLDSGGDESNVESEDRPKGRLVTKKSSRSAAELRSPDISDHEDEVSTENRARGPKRRTVKHASKITFELDSEESHSGSGEKGLVNSKYSSSSKKMPKLLESNQKVRKGVKSNNRSGGNKDTSGSEASNREIPDPTLVHKKPSRIDPEAKSDLEKKERGSSDSEQSKPLKSKRAAVQKKRPRSESEDESDEKSSSGSEQSKPLKSKRVAVQKKYSKSESEDESAKKSSSDSEQSKPLKSKRAAVQKKRPRSESEDESDEKGSSDSEQSKPLKSRRTAVQKKRPRSESEDESAKKSSSDSEQSKPLKSKLTAEKKKIPKQLSKINSHSVTSSKKAKLSKKGKGRSKDDSESEESCVQSEDEKPSRKSRTTVVKNRLKPASGGGSSSGPEAAQSKKSGRKESSVSKLQKGGRKAHIMSDSEESDQDERKEESSHKKKKKLAPKMPLQDNKQITNLKRFLTVAGIRPHTYASIWANCPTTFKRAEALRMLLRKHGLKGTPTTEKCRRIRERLEFKQDIADLDVSNILDNPNQRRSKRLTTNQPLARRSPKKQGALPSGFQHVYSRIRALGDSD